MCGCLEGFPEASWCLTSVRYRVEYANLRSEPCSLTSVESFCGRELRDNDCIFYAICLFGPGYKLSLYRFHLVKRILLNKVKKHSYHV